MPNISHLLELFEPPSSFLRKLEDPTYLSAMRAKYIVPTDYQTWLPKKYAQVESTIQIDMKKGRSSNQDTYLRSQKILLTEMQAQGIHATNSP